MIIDKNELEYLTTELKLFTESMWDRLKRLPDRADFEGFILRIRAELEGRNMIKKAESGGFRVYRYDRNRILKELYFSKELKIYSPELGEASQIETIAIEYIDGMVSVFIVENK